jgi:site-specific DNA-methyltransferase (adenine-specific)
VELVLGDCLEKLRMISSDSIDCIVTGPPYGGSFVEAAWDKTPPIIDIWKECLRVLKEGSFAFIMSAARQDLQARLITNLSDAGFNVAFTSLCDFSLETVVIARKGGVIENIPSIKNDTIPSIDPKSEYYHPAFNSQKLMTYLVGLGSRDNEVVLDPFMGTGTTGVACKNLNRRFIGIEINPEYFKTSKIRLSLC